MAPMKQLVTLSPSKCLVARSRTTYFRICYRTSWVLFIRETVVCIRKSTLMGSRILLYSTAQSMESANETLMIRNEGRRLRKLIQLLENEMNWERNDVQERTWNQSLGWQEGRESTSPNIGMRGNWTNQMVWHSGPWDVNCILLRRTWQSTVLMLHSCPASIDQYRLTLWRPKGSGALSG